MGHDIFLFAGICEGNLPVPLHNGPMTRSSDAAFDARLNTLRPRQNGRHFPDDIFKGIFLNENEWISLKISLKFVPKVRINNITALVQIMAWRRPGDKPLSGPMMVSLLTHLCVARPQWVNQRWNIWSSWHWFDTPRSSCNVSVMDKLFPIFNEKKTHISRCPLMEFSRITYDDLR